MSIFGSSININPSNLGHLTFTNDTKYNCVSKSYYIKSNTDFNVNTSKNINLDSITGNISVIVNEGCLRLNSNGNLSNAIIIDASNANGGILQTAGIGGVNIIANNGDINSLSKGADINIGVSPIGTPVEEQTQNVNIDCFNNFNITSGDMYFVSSDVISFISETGDIEFGSSANGNPIIKFQNGNFLVNQKISNLDYQLDIAITDSSHNNNYKGYNGIMVTTNLSNVAADLTLQTSNTLGDGTQSILSLGSYGSNNNNSIFNSYIAYQVDNYIIRSDSNFYNPNSLNINNGKDFIYADIGRNIYWPSININDTITGLSSIITSINDNSNISISGSYTGETSRVYLLMIDGIGTPNTFKWSNDGGNTYQQQLIPILLTPINLDNGMAVLFADTSGFTYNQQFTFQTKIIAFVNNTQPIPNPIPLYVLQSFYSYIGTTTPSDIVFKTNNNEKMRITGDGSIGIQQNLPKASLDLNSDYNKLIHVNQTITGYQINPAIGYLESGGYVVVWNSQDSINPDNHFDVIAQRYLTDGSRFSNNFQVNIISNNNQSFPAISGQKLEFSNHFIVVWTSQNALTNLYTIYCQIYHNNLPLRTFDIEVNTSIYILSNPRVAGLYNGNYIIVWDQNNSSGIYNIYGRIITDDATFQGSSNKLNPSPLPLSRKYPFVIGLSNNDTYTPNGFVVGYMVATTNINDPQYTIAVRVFDANSVPTTNEIPITSISTNTYSNISDGLLSLAGINNNNVNSANGGFILSFYRSYLADTSLYNNSDPIQGLTSGATAIIFSRNAPLRQITLQNISNRFLVSEEIQISSSIPNIGTIVEKIAAITYTGFSTAIITLDVGSKNIEAYRFNSNLSQVNDALWINQVNTSPLYNDQDRFTGNASIFQYKRPMSYVCIDNYGTALITWSNNSIPNIYYQLLDVDTGNLIGIENKLTTEYNGLKQRNQVATHLQSIEGNDYGFVIAWDNQSLDLQDTGIFQQLIGYNHSLLNLEDGVSNFIFNHYNLFGIGTNSPESSLHIKTKKNSNTTNTPENTATIKIQNTSQYVITNKDLQSIEFVDGSNNVLNKIQSVNSLRYDDLYPQPNNLIGFYKFDQTTGTQVVDYSILNTNNRQTSSYINTNGILNNFNIESCWVPGIINNSLLFNGYNNFVFVENTAINSINTVLETGLQQLSISVWINIPSEIVNGASYDIISNGGDFGLTGTYLLNVTDIANTGNIILTTTVITHDPLNVNTLINNTIQGYTLLNDTTWHHIVLTVNIINDNCIIKMYVDGNLENNITNLGAITALQHGDTKTFFGSRDGLSNFFCGNIDELRIYNSILSQNEIKQLYNYGNPNQPTKASLFLSPNNTDTHNQSIVIDDDGKINNLSSRPLPYTILSGQILAAALVVNMIGTDTNFINELTVGDIIILGNVDYTVISITDNTHLSIDRSAYSGPEANITFNSILRKPSIYSFFDNSDSLRGNIDNYGNMVIGNSKPSTMLEISGSSGNSKLIPEITITNTSIENDDQSRLTAINFRGYDAINNNNAFVNLGNIQTSHYGVGVDNQASMQFNINDGTGSNFLNQMSITTSGIGFGGENSPLTLMHAITTDQTNECSFLLQSSYRADSIITRSVFDERSNIYFGGLASANSGDITKNILCSISGSKDTLLDRPQGRIDFNTNNDNNVNSYGVESRLSILNTGNVGIDITQPVNLFNVSPEYRNTNTNLKSIIQSTSPDGSIIILDNQLFTGLSEEEKNMFLGGSVVVENNNNTLCMILNVELAGGINDRLTVNSNLSAYVGYTLTIHYPGLNVQKQSGFVGVNTTTPSSVLSVNGSMSLPITYTNSDMLLDCTHYTVLCDPAANNIVITLPNNLTTNYNLTGRIYILKKISLNYALFIDPANGNIDNTPGPYTVTTSFIQLQCDGYNWWIIG